MHSVSESIDDLRVEPSERTRVFEHSGDDPVEIVVTEALSMVTGVDPVQLDARLYDFVDPDSLERLVRSGGESIEVSFRFGEHRVTLFGNDRIAVTDTPSANGE
ncbi:MAG: HalOD1 output domain-containing protein [Halanaeroarchaeum sp.]